MSAKEKFLWLLLVLVMGTILVISLKNHLTNSLDLPVLSAVQNFSLTNQKNESVGLESFQGRVWIANFIFTSCGGQCPRMSAQMAKIQSMTPQRIALVSFSVDPEQDTPEVLSRYAAKYSASERWHFLTGRREVIYSLAEKSFKLGVSEKGGSSVEPILHSSRFVLVDQQARIRGFYDSESQEFPGNLIRAAAHLND